MCYITPMKNYMIYICRAVEGIVLTPPDWRRACPDLKDWGEANNLLILRKHLK